MRWDVIFSAVALAILAWTVCELAEQAARYERASAQLMELTHARSQLSERIEAIESRMQVYEAWPPSVNK